MSDEIMKESVTVVLDAGQINVDDVGGTREAIESVLLSGLGACKARGVTASNLKLTFKSTTKS